MQSLTLSMCMVGSLKADSGTSCPMVNEENETLP